jgi:uncharacterized protein YkwD
MPRSRHVWIGLLAILLAANGPVWGQVDEPAAERGRPSAELTPSQKRAISTLLTHYRRAKSDWPKRAGLVQQAMSYGPFAVEALLDATERELRPELDRYQAKFQQQAAALAKKQIGAADLEEIARLRQSVNGLRGEANLTKEQIIQQADPAMARLAEIFLVNPAEVVGGSKSLQDDRAKLQALGALWEQLAAYLQQSLPGQGEAADEPVRFEGLLASEEELAAGMAIPMDPATRAVLAGNARLAGGLDMQEARAVAAVNLTRNLLGLGPLAIDPRLAAAARDHSQDMARLSFFSHDSPVEGKATPWDRAKRFGTTASGENIFMGTQDGHGAAKAWFHSPPHHKIMLGDHKRVGIGRSGKHFTALFGG